LQNTKRGGTATGRRGGKGLDGSRGRLGDWEWLSIEKIDCEKLGKPERR